MKTQPNMMMEKQLSVKGNDSSIILFLYLAGVNITFLFAGSTVEFVLALK